MTALVEVRVLRPLTYQGQRREADEVLRVPPVDAWVLCSGMRAQMLNGQRDGAAVRAAVSADTAAALRSANRPRPAGHIAGDPWRPK